MGKKTQKKDELKELESFINSLIENNGGIVKEEWLKLLSLQGYHYKKNAKKVVKADKEPEDYTDFRMMIQKCLLETPPEAESILQERIAFYAVNFLKLAEIELAAEHDKVNKGWFEAGKAIIIKQIMDKNWRFQFDLDDNGNVLQMGIKQEKSK